MNRFLAKRLRQIAKFVMLHKRLSIAVGVFGTFSIAPILLLAGNQAVQAIDSTVFCTQVCHTAHATEATTLQETGHRQVTCAQCHVGAGTINLVKSKIQGLSELLPTITGNYARPIPALPENRVSTTETCQTCHSPTKHYGDVPLIKTTFSTDASSSSSKSTIVLKVNGGTRSTANGVHWHATADVWYFATGSQQQRIAWAATENASGQLEQYVNPTLVGQISAAGIQNGNRRMDCIDCHNRVAHPVRSAEDLVDRALAEGSLDASLPFIKLVAMNALGAANTTLRQANDRIDQIKDYYRVNYSQLYRIENASIESTVAKLKDIAALAMLPDGTGPDTYPPRNVHNKPDADGAVDFKSLSRSDAQGCFRCHGTLVKVNPGNPPLLDHQKDKQNALRNAVGTVDVAELARAVFAEQDKPDETKNDGKTGPGELANSLDADCNLCHYTPAAMSSRRGPGRLPLANEVNHPVEGLDNCLICHNPNGPQPFKNTHNWATNGACLACHRVSANQKPLPDPAAPKAPETPHTIGKLDTCLLCHGPKGSKPMKADHAWVTDKTCDACHRMAAKPVGLPASAPPKSPETSHAIDGLDNCLVCHGPTGPKPFKQDHAWVTNETCRTCHTLSAKPKPIPNVAPPKAPDTSHSTGQLDDCLICHSPGGPKAFKPDHAWVTNETCKACHKQSTNPKPLQVLAPANARKTPHVTKGLETCLACHSPLGPRPFSVSHPWVTDDVCSACHKPSPTPPVPMPEPLPAAASIRHSIIGLPSCTACHRAGGPAPHAATHAGRPATFCLICHKTAQASLPPAALPSAPAISHSIAGLTACSMCHYTGGPAPFVADHLGRPDSLCQICHGAAGSKASIGLFTDAGTSQRVSVLELGTLAQGASTSVTYYVKNTGTSPTTVSAGTNNIPARMGTLAMIFDGQPQRTLAPGQTVVVVATFTPTEGAAPGDFHFDFSIAFTGD